MFICDFCKKSSQPGEKLNFIVGDTRDKVYPSGGFGFETVREYKACSECKDNHEKVSKSEPLKIPAANMTPKYKHESNGDVVVT